jgi:hypothetical protein
MNNELYTDALPKGKLLWATSDLISKKNVSTDNMFFLSLSKYNLMIQFKITKRAGLALNPNLPIFTNVYL